MRHWSVRHARRLKQVYVMLEFVLVKLAPVISRIGYQRLEGPIFAVEKALKSVLLDSQSCGQCVVGSTGMSCPMNCPKALRNGPCGGVRQSGKCEIEPTMTCVWLMAWEGNKRMAEKVHPIQLVQPAIDNRLMGTSAWLREVRQRVSEMEKGVLS